MPSKRRALEKTDGASAPRAAVARVARTKAAGSRKARAANAHVVVALPDDAVRTRAIEVLRANWKVSTVDTVDEVVAAAHADAALILTCAIRHGGFDPLRLVRRLRSDARTAHVPIIVTGETVSTSTMTVVLVAGAADFLFQPFSDFELVSRVRAHIEMGALRRTENARRRANAIAAMRDAFADVDADAMPETAMRALAARDESMMLITTVLASAPIGFALAGLNVRFLRVNERFAQITGRAMNEHIGRPYADVVPEALARAMRRAVSEVLDTMRPVLDVSVHFPVVHAGRREERHVVASFYPVRIGGRLVGIGLIVDDVTERELIARELSATNATLDDMLRVRDQFLAVVSHELRTPLAAIDLWSKALVAGDPSKVDAHVLERAVASIRANASSLSRIIEDLLDISRASAAKLSLVPGPVDLSAVLERMVESFRPEVTERDVTLALPTPMPRVKVIGDAHRLEQVFRNLVVNAIRHVDPGGHVNVQVVVDGTHVVVTVQDDGVGIAPEHLSRIFEPFQQAGPGRGGGLGLGLAVARQLVDLHGGTIQAHSKGLGFGAEFVVVLPRRTREKSDVVYRDSDGEPHGQA